MAHVKVPHNPTTGSEPPTPYIDKGASPFLLSAAPTGTGLHWTANVEIALVDQPNGKRVVARIHEGEKAQAVTGEGHSIPLRVLAKHDHSDGGVKAGDIIYSLHYTGEGAWKVWHSDQIVEIENFSDKGPYPHYTWWVKLRTTSGIIAWTISHGNFSNQDACR
jgi:hypothetical protein